MSSLLSALLAYGKLSHTVSLDLGFINVNTGCSETKKDETSPSTGLYYSDLIEQKYSFYKI